MAKKNSNKKKSQGIWIIEKRGPRREIVAAVLRKTWDTVQSIDLYHLYEFEWTTQAISEKFNVKPIQVINRLRKYA